MRRARRPGDDPGFTLIELVVTIVIMGVITIPLGNFVLAYFKNLTTTQTRLSDSHDIEIATAYFSQDVANTGLRVSAADATTQQSVWAPPTDTLPATYCGKGLGTTILLLKWGDPTTVGSNDAVDSAAYVVVSGTLHRVFCSGGTTTTSDTIVIHNLTGGNPTIGCPSTTTTCGTSTPPTKVTMTFSVRNSAATSVTVSGQRRQT